MGNTHKRLKAKASAWPVPETPKEAADAIARIGQLQRRRQVLEGAMNESMASIKAGFEREAAPLNAEIKGLCEALQGYCASRRSELTKNGRRKFCRFATGRVHWRMTPPKVTLTTKVAHVIAWLEASGPERFLRRKVEVDKQAMLAEPGLAATVPGVSITQGEDFVIVPFETKLEEIS